VRLVSQLLLVRKPHYARGVSRDGNLWIRCSACCRGSDAPVICWPGCVVAMTCPECRSDLLVSVEADWDAWDDWDTWCDGEFCEVRR